MMKASEIRELTAEELAAKLGDLKKDLFNLRLQLATNQLENTNKITEVKRDIAQAKVIFDNAVLCTVNQHRCDSGGDHDQQHKDQQRNAAGFLCFAALGPPGI